MIRSPVTVFLEYMRERTYTDEDLVSESGNDSVEVSDGTSSNNGEEIAIRIVCSQELVGEGENQISVSRVAEGYGLRPNVAEIDSDDESNEGSVLNVNADVEREVGNNRVRGLSNIDTSYQRHYIQQATRWIEQVLPFSLLLLLIFIRQHLQGIDDFVL